MIDPGEGVEARVVQRIEGAVSITLRKSGSVAFVFQASDPSDTSAVNTAEELDRIHNGTNSSATNVAYALRAAILDHMTSVTLEVVGYLANLGDASAEAAKRPRGAALMSRRAPYSMLVRSLFASNPTIRALFD